MLTDLICFSHLKWNFVYQRPQHLLSRYAKSNRVFFIEEPVFDADEENYQISPANEANVWVVVFHLNKNLSEDSILQKQKSLLFVLMQDMDITDYSLWYYTPLALSYTAHLKPNLIVYDCMDELSAFRFAPPLLKQKETELMQIADVVFTGGYSLYEAKKGKHANIFPFPSSIDREHFFSARDKTEEPADQKEIPHPRFGFYGVVDERFDIKLLRDLALKRPQWHFIIIGPVVKIDPSALPKSSNIHYLGSKHYNNLPEYLSGWDVAIMPFALNESTKYISPTKTPEYLAGGKPVISTSIKDVVEPYGNNGLVYIADTVNDFMAAGNQALQQKDKEKWMKKVDSYLANISWDKTWNKMMLALEDTLKKNYITKTKKINEYV